MAVLIAKDVDVIKSVPLKPGTSCMRFALHRLPAPLVAPFVLSFLTTQLAPEASLFEKGALLVNAHGDLFRREGENLGSAIARQPGKQAYALLDGDVMEMFSRWPHYVSTAPGVQPSGCVKASGAERRGLLICSWAQSTRM